ncbi:hypothetical protein AAFP30_16810 [Gordonia sp. CPCC 205515]|uniref:hypothetical protein n=1 Tax=Gordonia sp. CPCC 205515 TaxID=3140791 RepID=UPI003AF33AC8
MMRSSISQCLHALIRTAIVVAALMAVGPMALAVPAIARADAPLTPPSQPTRGLGANGPCAASTRIEPNPHDITQKITIYSPAGRGATPLTGGHCNDAKRPVVVVVHGLLAGIDDQLLGSSLLYADIINHFVSTGNVVVFASWPTNPYDFARSVPKEDAALTIAKNFAPRGDFTRLGIVGHSMGGGAVPYLAQHAVARGWGSKALWLFQLAPAFATGVGTGKIALPAHTHVVVENYDHDNILDARLGIDQFSAYTVPVSNKRYVMVRSDVRGPLQRLDATHLSPNTLLAPNDAVRFFGIYRVGDALQSCSLTGRFCDTDLSYMGRWSDGRPVTPAISTVHPVDAGPRADAFSAFGLPGECDTPANPRAAVCPS